MVATDQSRSERSHGFPTAACTLKIRLSLVMRCGGELGDGTFSALSLGAVPGGGNDRIGAANFAIDGSWPGAASGTRWVGFLDCS